FVPIWM
uniref:Electrin-1 n=1 Tax=Litoria rubella TaxID=104895 RepID=EI01_LITRU|nr:RecName: Full=Electrin-1 [Litoria rubella]